MKFLFLSTRQAKPSYRFRVEQFLPWFQKRGHECEVAFLSAKPLARLWFYRRLRQFDAVFLQKRLLSQAEIHVLRHSARRLVYDLDDAVMLNGEGQPETRRQSRFRAMVSAADVVICGNSYLAEQSRPFARRLEIIPTCINSQLYHPLRRPSASGPLIIGWTGSRSTNAYLNEVLPAIASLNSGVMFKFLSDTTSGVNLELLGSVPHQFVPWSPAVEISETATFDIGLMPLPDNPWTRGKCGFKALQYMGLGIPTVCSPVGVNSEIVTHEKNGLHATTATDWRTALTRLANSPTLRESLGKAGRQTIEKRYALNVQAPRLVDLMEEIALPLKRSA